MKRADPGSFAHEIQAKLQEKKICTKENVPSISSIRWVLIDRHKSNNSFENRVLHLNGLVSFQQRVTSYYLVTSS